TAGAQERASDAVFEIRRTSVRHAANELKGRAVGKNGRAVGRSSEGAPAPRGLSFYITDNTKADLRYCLDCKLLPLVSLQIKQRGQIAMIDADACFGSDGRFGMNRH